MGAVGAWSQWGEREEQHEVKTGCPGRDLGHGLRVLGHPLISTGSQGAPGDPGWTQPR